MQEAKIETQTVTYLDGKTELEGYLAIPKGDSTPKPGVMVIHEWFGEGAYVRKRADQIAALGYVGFAIDIYGKGLRATNPDEAGKLMMIYKNDRKLLRQRAKAALDFLNTQPQVKGKPVAAIGYCFGGCVALEMARDGMDLKGVVSFHGALDTPMPAELGKVKAKVLALHGTEDPFVPQAHVEAFENEMQKAKVDCQLVKYSGVQHSFTNPDADKVGVAGLAYNAAADKRSWLAMQNFLGEIFNV